MERAKNTGLKGFELENPITQALEFLVVVRDALFGCSLEQGNDFPLLFFAEFFSYEIPDVVPAIHNDFKQIEDTSPDEIFNGSACHKVNL